MQKSDAIAKAEKILDTYCDPDRAAKEVHKVLRGHVSHEELSGWVSTAMTKARENFARKRQHS